MNFLLDESFSRLARGLLEGVGHRVFDLKEIGLLGASDSEVMEAACARSAVVLTTNRDFFHSLGREYPEHHGIVVIGLK